MLRTFRAIENGTISIGSLATAATHSGLGFAHNSVPAVVDLAEVHEAHKQARGTEEGAPQMTGHDEFSGALRDLREFFAP